MEGERGTTNVLPPLLREVMVAGRGGCYSFSGIWMSDIFEQIKGIEESQGGWQNERNAIFYHFCIVRALSPGDMTVLHYLVRLSCPVSSMYLYMPICLSVIKCYAIRSVRIKNKKMGITCHRQNRTHASIR